jgi:hypothetical protein
VEQFVPDEARKLRVFISGASTSHEQIERFTRLVNDGHPGAEVSPFPFDSVDCQWFASRFPPNSTLETAFKELRLADMLVFWLTDDALGSPLVREEVIHAHYLGIRIVAVANKKHLEGEGGVERRIAEVFSFGQDVTIVTWEGVDISAAVRGFQTHVYQVYSNGHAALALSLLRELRRIGSASFMSPRGNLDLALAAEPVFKLRLARRLARNQSVELRQVFSGHYEINLSLEENFLHRAGEIFSSAKEVFAISRDDVSHFWVEENSKSSAFQYIKAQCPKTHRVFVFGDAERAHYHAEVLDEHARRYGETGAVFVCSVPTFRSLLESCYLAPLGQLNEDFGLLEMVDSEGESRLLHAQLGASSLRFSYVSGQEQDARMRLIESIRSAKEASQAAFEAAVSSQGAPQLSSKNLLVKAGVSFGADCTLLRWVPTLSAKDRNGWTELLRDLFPSPQGSVQHMLLLANNDGVRTALRRVREEIAIAFKRADIEGDVWLGKREVSRQIRDRSTGGCVSNDIETEQHQHMLLMPFRQLSELEKWYSEANHSPLRRKLYSSLSAELSRAYEELDKIETDHDRARFFEEHIENVARRYVHRMDFREDIDLENIVGRSPYPFREYQMVFRPS